MTLFEGCQQALSADFRIVGGLKNKEVIDILNKYPFIRGGVNWQEI